MRKAMLLALALAMPACAGIRVTTQTAPGAELSGLETFAQAAHDGSAPRVQDVVYDEIGRQLEARGFRRVAHDDADFVVAFRARSVARSRRQLAGDPDANYYRVKNYITGTLVINVFPVGSPEPIWHGVAEADITRAGELRPTAAKAVRAILAEFPPAS